MITPLLRHRARDLLVLDQAVLVSTGNSALCSFTGKNGAICLQTSTIGIACSEMAGQVGGEKLST